MLELYDGKLSRTVLRRESGSNARDLSGIYRKDMCMKMKICVLSIVVLMPVISYADYFSGNEIMECWNDKYSVNNPMIRGYFAGVQDSYNGVYFCVDEGVKMSQAAEVIIKYMKDNPEKWHKAGKNLVIDALSKAFPCDIESNEAK